jgi:uncharacterized membrane protein
VRGHGDLRAAIAAALLCAVAALVLPFGALRLVFAAPLTLFLPGYAITAATFARRRIDRPKLLLLSVGLSLAVLALGSLVLNYAPGGIRAGSWALLLVLVVVAASRAAALRRPAAAASKPTWSLSPSPLEAGLLAAGSLAAIGAIVLAFVPMSAKDAIGYSEMWIQPFAPKAGAGVRIGVGNHMQNRGAYRLRVRFGAEGEVTVKRDFALDPGESQVLRLPVAVSPSDEPLPVAAILYQERNPDRPYRRVTTWIPAPGEAG